MFCNKCGRNLDDKLYCLPCKISYAVPSIKKTPTLIAEPLPHDDPPPPRRGIIDVFLHRPAQQPTPAPPAINRNLNRPRATIGDGIRLIFGFVLGGLLLCFIACVACESLIQRPAFSVTAPALALASSPYSRSPYSTNPPPAPAFTLPIPDQQSRFINLINTYASRYSAAPNQLVKSDLRTERAQRLQTFFNGRNDGIGDWVGTVSAMRTDTDRNARFMINLPNSKIFIGNLESIPHRSPMYEYMATLKEGDHVRFSGWFVGAADDYLRESSITEDGAMTEPDFTFTYYALSKIN